jgi:Homing endonuclease associated repeat
MTREEIIQAIKDCAEQLGRPPSLPELKARKDVLVRHIRSHFLTYQSALQECGLEGEGPGRKAPMESLFKDWAGLVRRLGKVPTMGEYAKYSKYSPRPLTRLFKSWYQVPKRLLVLAEANGWNAEWQDVVDIARPQPQGAGTCAATLAQTGGTHSRTGIFPDRPTYGPPVVRLSLAHGPTNETGVVFLFGMLAAQAGFVVTRIQTEYPDCEAMCEVAPGVWQRVRIEFEYESRNFLKHHHDTDGCDVIVCWVHNWPECPLRVVELSKVLSSQPDLFARD